MGIELSGESTGHLFGLMTELADQQFHQGFGVLIPALSGLISQLGAWLCVWWGGLAGELDGDGFEFGDELAQVAGRRSRGGAVRRLRW